MRRVGVEGGDADLGEIGDGAFVEGLGVLDDVEERSALRSERRREDAAVGGDEIVGGDGIAVGPFCVGAEVEGVGEAVGGRIPALGDAGDGFEIDGVFSDEALKEGGEDVVFGESGREVRVEFADLRADAAMEDLVAIATFDGGFAFAAGGESRGQKYEERGANDQ